MHCALCTADHNSQHIVNRREMPLEVSLAKSDENICTMSSSSSSAIRTCNNNNKQLVAFRTSFVTLANIPNAFRMLSSIYTVPLIARSRFSVTHRRTTATQRMGPRERERNPFAFVMISLQNRFENISGLLHATKHHSSHVIIIGKRHSTSNHVDVNGQTIVEIFIKLPFEADSMA